MFIVTFHRPLPSKYYLPPRLSGIERVSSVKLLGVHLTESLSMDEHVRQTISVGLCNQRLYMLCQLKRQGLPQARNQGGRSGRTTPRQSAKGPLSQVKKKFEQ